MPERFPVGSPHATPELPPDPIRHSLRHGTRVVIAAQLVSQLVTIGVLAVLYRRLGPEPYGLLGMVTPLLLLLRIGISGGLDVAAIQHHDLSNQQASVLFWLNQGLGLAMTLLAIALAPALAWFYESRQVMSLSVVLSGTSLVVALGMQHQARLQRRLRLGTLAVLRLASQAVGGTAAIAAALAGWGVWSLAAQQYAEFGALSALAWWAEPWRPQWALRRMGTRPLLRFGGYYALSSVMFYITANVDKILVGRMLGPVALGLYSQAFTWMMKPVSVVITPLGGIMLPALSRTAGDPQRYARLLLGFFRWIALAMFPAGIGLMLVAGDAMSVLGGPRWAAAGPLLTVLAASTLVQGFVNALGSVLASVGRARRLCAAAAAIAVVMSGAFFLGIQAGRSAGAATLGVAAGYSLALVFCVFPPYLVLCLRTVGVPMSAWLAQLRGAALAAAGMGLLVAACHALLVGVEPLSALPAVARLVIEITVGALSYAILARREIRWFLRAGRDGR
jgi:PST family polysaccharide transporter